MKTTKVAFMKTVKRISMNGIFLKRIFDESRQNMQIKSGSKNWHVACSRPPVSLSPSEQMNLHWKKTIYSCITLTQRKGHISLAVYYSQLFSQLQSITTF